MNPTARGVGYTFGSPRSVRPNRPAPWHPRGKRGRQEQASVSRQIRNVRWLGKIEMSGVRSRDIGNTRVRVPPAWASAPGASQPPRSAAIFPEIGAGCSPRPTARLPLPFYHHSSCRAGDLWATGKLSTDPQLGLWALWVTGMLSTSPQAPVPSKARYYPPQIVLKSLKCNPPCLRTFLLPMSPTVPGWGGEAS